MSTQTVLQFEELIRRPRARTSDPKTSHEAAKSVASLNKKQRFILNLIREAPGTDEELWEHISKYTFAKISESGARTRRAEITIKEDDPTTKDRPVKDSGQRRKTRSGRNAIVWEVV